MIVNFTIPGEPKAKARPRVTKKGIAYTPKETTEYENWVRQCYVTGNQGKILKGQIKVIINAYFSIPKSTSQKKQKEMKNFLLRPTKKPDTDNIAKIVLDSLNKIAFDDDKQVIDLRVLKFYSENPRVEVTLDEI
jgi:Holliday junction resolvase RusA-like endonuclease